MGGLGGGLKVEVTEACLGHAAVAVALVASSLDSLLESGTRVYQLLELLTFRDVVLFFLGQEEDGGGGSRSSQR